MHLVYFLFLSLISKRPSGNLLSHTYPKSIVMPTWFSLPLFSYLEKQKVETTGYENSFQNGFGMEMRIFFWNRFGTVYQNAIFFF